MVHYFCGRKAGPTCLNLLKIIHLAGDKSWQVQRATLSLNTTHNLFQGIYQVRSQHSPVGPSVLGEQFHCSQSISVLGFRGCRGYTKVVSR